MVSNSIMATYLIINACESLFDDDANEDEIKDGARKAIPMKSSFE